MTQELTPTTGTHPLRTRGPGRALYAGGLAGELAGLLLLTVGTTGVLVAVGNLQFWFLVTAMAFQHGGATLRRRAWWYVPLRGARPRPDRIDAAFWTVFAVAVVVVAVVSVQGPPSDEQLFGLWPLLLFSSVPVWWSPTRRDHVEPAGRWAPRAAPCAVAVLAVLWLGTTHDRFSPVAAVCAGTVVAAGAMVSQAVRRRRSPEFR